MRIGHGYDVHEFGPGDHIVIGGVTIPHTHGIRAHSDGDVLVHALCDALLGAAGLGDIGRHFPDCSNEFKDIDSRVLLRRVVEMLSNSGLRISNIDSTVIAQRPKLSPYIPDMRARLADDIGISMARINVKATTTEGLGFAGRHEGIAAHGVVLLEEGS